MTTSNNTIYANATVTKLKENSMSYGKPETVNYAFVISSEKEINCYSAEGNHLRTFRKGTKLLINYTGTIITRRAYDMRVKKNAILAKKAQLEREAKQAEEMAIRQEIAKNQLSAWVKFLSENPEKRAKYIGKVNSMPSSKWRNLLKMKAAKYINNESFEGLEVSAPELKSALFN